MRAPAASLVGSKFGRITVLLALRENGRTRVSGRCDCGAAWIGVLSCGCLKSERLRADNYQTTHGQTYTPTWNSWQAMLARCTRKTATAFSHYGGRGITVCERWQSFENFLSDMGERPAGKTLDRIDVNGNYEPSNCRWATAREQANNRRHRPAALGAVIPLRRRLDDTRPLRSRPCLECNGEGSYQDARTFRGETFTVTITCRCQRTED